jgi:hypothetical protein
LSLPAKHPGTLRFCLGLSFFALSWLMPFSAFWIAALACSPALKAVLIGLVSIGGPELAALAAIVILGKESFDLIASRSFAFLKQLAPKASVGRRRYNIGLVMFVLPVLPWYIIAYAPQLLPPSAPGLRLSICLGSDLCFWSSLFVLGGDFWEKLRSLFIYEARAIIPPAVPERLPLEKRED